MTILFTQEWDIIREKEKEYDDFISQEYIPRSNEMNLCSVGGYYVEVGFGPRIISVKSIPSMNDLSEIMVRDEFKKLMLELQEYVVNYGNRILSPTGRVQTGEYKIQKGVWKYNMYYDHIPGTRSEYADFITNEFLPVLDAIDYVEVTGGWDVIMGGISQIIGELTFKSPIDIGRLLENPTFRSAVEKLRRRYVRNFRTRILRTTERFEEPRWYRL